MEVNSDHDHRTHLPSVMSNKHDINLWNILKNSIGKDLSKITIPVIFNEPISFLQRLTEYLEYSVLLDKASAMEDPVKRMEFVAAFAVSGLSCNWKRMRKPFNPLLGETYEFQQQGFRIICEQISHHPPVSAFHADSPVFKFYGTIHPKITFTGKTIEINPSGVTTLELLRSVFLVVRYILFYMAVNKVLKNE